MTSNVMFVPVPVPVQSGALPSTGYGASPDAMLEQLASLLNSYIQSLNSSGSNQGSARGMPQSPFGGMPPPFGGMPPPFGGMPPPFGGMPSLPCGGAMSSNIWGQGTNGAGSTSDSTPNGRSLSAKYGASNLTNKQWVAGQLFRGFPGGFKTNGSDLKNAAQDSSDPALQDAAQYVMNHPDMALELDTAAHGGDPDNYISANDEKAEMRKFGLIGG